MEEIRVVDPQKDAADIAEINAWFVENTTTIFDLIPPTVEEMKTKIENFVAAGFPYYVYIKEGKLEGYCYAHPWKEKRAYYPTWENTIYLREGSRAQGVGRRLMEKLEKECRSRGCHSLIACITAENEGSCRFHEKLGFEKVSHFRQVGEKFGRLLDVVDYQKLL